jgi:hypothetical protein
MQNVSLKLPLSTLALLHRLAEEEDVSLGQIVRDAVDREVKRRTLARATAPRRRKPLALWRAEDDDFVADEPKEVPEFTVIGPLPRFGSRRIAQAS